MPSFFGNYSVTLDEHSRFTVPAKIRKTLEKYETQDLICCIQDENYLVVFPEEEWDLYQQQTMKTLNPLMTQDRNQHGEVFSKGERIEVKSNKISIPADHRDVAGIKKEAVVSGGISNTFEIWNPERWEARDRAKKRSNKN